MQVGNAGSPPCSHLAADDTFDCKHMLVTPRCHGIVEIDKLFSQLIEFPIFFRLAIDFQKGGLNFR